MQIRRLGALCLLAVALIAVSLLSAGSASAELVDSDGDGIPDIIETNGIRDANGHVLVDLKAMGADPHHKDLFVQCDYMNTHSHTHKPKAEALKKVIDAFAHAPVSNPDGQPGIHLHLDAGPQSIMDPVTGAKWGELSAVHEVAHLDNIGTEDAQENYDWSPLDQIKSAHFPAARTPVFRYCLWAHKYANCGSSGIARGLPGDDLLVTLGDFDGQEGTVMDQAGTFMHELGHTLGLQHGGSDGMNYKPNFFSIMSYNYQFQGLRIDGLDGTLDYSRHAVPALDEHALGAGVNGCPHGFGVRWRTMHGGEADDRVSDEGTHIDWAGNGGQPHSLDVNGDGEITELTATPDEWAALSYVGEQVGDYSKVMAGAPHKGQAPPRYSKNKETATKKEADKVPTDYQVSTVLSDDLEGHPGATLTVHFVLTNEGRKEDTYTLSAENAEGWADASHLPHTVTLAPGKKQEFEIQVHIAANAKAGQVEEFGVEAVSKANPKILDSAEITITAQGP